MTNDPAPTAEPVRLLDKVSALLELLAEREQATAAELAEVLGEPRSSVHRLLRQLYEVGWVDQSTGRGQWTVGLQLFRLGSTAVQRMDVRKAALPHMVELHEYSGETVFLIIRRDLVAVCIERLEGRRVQSIALMLGGSMPLHCGAGPLALLAHLPDEVHREWMVATSTSGLEQMNRSEPPTVASVEEELKLIRARGYAVSDRDVTPGIAAVGAPVFDYRGRVVAAMSVSGIRESILDPELDLAGRTVAAAAAASRDLGHRAAAPAARRLR